MKIIRFFNQKSSLFTIWDIKLAQLTAMLLVLILVKYIPVLLKIDVLVLIVLLIISALRPCYVMFFKKS